MSFCAASPSPLFSVRKPSSNGVSSEPEPPLVPTLSKEEINALPIRAWEGPVCLVRNEKSLDAALSDLCRQKVLGFDTETRPAFARGKSFPPALIQLATARTVYLIQLVHIPFNERMAALLATAFICKAGVAINDDMKALTRIRPFQSGGTVDLAVMARARGIQAQGLRTLAASLLGFRISKGARCSNWENPELTAQQIKYAATDAWVGREIYLQLIKKSSPPNALVPEFWRGRP